MNLLSALPVIGNIVGKVAEKIWPDRQAEKLKRLEIELEAVKQSGGRVTPRQALQYVAVGVIVVFAVLLAASFVARIFIPDFPVPEGWDEILSFCVSLFGL